MSENELTLEPREDGKPLSQEKRKLIYKIINEEFHNGKLTPHGMDEPGQYGEPKGYRGSYEEIYDASVREKSPPHIQMFEGVVKADDMFGRAHYVHSNTTAVIPESDDKLRIAIKTPEEVKRDPALAAHKDKLLKLTEHLMPDDHYSLDFAPNKPERIVIMYDEKGDIARAFGGTMQVEHKRHYFATKEEDRIFEHYNTTPENPRIELQKTYNAKLGTIQDIKKQELDIPLDADQDYAPTPKQAQEFIDEVKSRKLTELERPAGISDEVLLAARDATKPRDPENIPFAEKAKSNQFVLGA